ncbi:MAG: DNA polymerase III subunit delta, partial [Candidatus Electrothrix sp. AR4]|nr:DNA polymerase III subunit delta [Candidatus Electrothrix sp. AR4]
MPVYEQNTIHTLLKEIKSGISFPAYLLVGERYLCQQAAEQITETLCANGGIVHSIDGDSEDSGTTLAKLRSFSLLGGQQVFRVNNSRLFHSKNVTKSIWSRATKAKETGEKDKAIKYLRSMMEAGGLDSNDPENNISELSATQWKKCFGFAKPTGNLDWTGKLIASRDQERQTEPASASAEPTGNTGEVLLAALESGIPENNTLMLLAEEVDKRKKLYKSFNKNFPVVNLRVDTGSTAQAQKAQQGVLREQVNGILKKTGKTMATGVMEQLFERVGFHPVAVVMETEKLTLFIGEAPQITQQDLNSMVGRTRQEAVFELTQAISDKKLEHALLISSRLQENGIHALAVLATLRNFTRTLLLFRSLLEQERYNIRPNISAKLFQEQC